MRVYDFLKEVNPKAAAKIVRQLNTAVKNLPQHPYMGPRLDSYAPLHVRSLIVGDYEIRYEVTDKALIIVRLWHTRENR
jgi:plasmid stabilization system protein ParE